MPSVRQGGPSREDGQQLRLAPGVAVGTNLDLNGAEQPPVPSEQFDVDDVIEALDPDAVEKGVLEHADRFEDPVCLLKGDASDRVDAAHGPIVPCLADC